MSVAAMMYPPFFQAEIAASDALIEEAVELMDASVGAGPEAFQLAQSEWHAAIVMRGQLMSEVYMVCSCCGSSDASIDRWGGCRCDIGTCRKCDPDEQAYEDALVREDEARA